MHFKEFHSLVLNLTLGLQTITYTEDGRQHACELGGRGTPARIRTLPLQEVVSLGADRTGLKGQGDNTAFETSHQHKTKQIINMQKHQL